MILNPSLQTMTCKIADVDAANGIAAHFKYKSQIRLQP